MKKVGIIIGRFQVSKLTKGHLHLIDSVRRDFGDNTIIFIGETKHSERTSHDPLPYEARKAMINESYSRIDKIFLIRDIGDYPKWVKKLDEKIELLKELEEIPKDSEIYICGSRDSVVDRYKEYGGIHNTKQYPDVKDLNKTVSGTDQRNEVIKYYVPSWDNEELREFLVWWYGKNDND